MLHYIDLKAILYRWIFTTDVLYICLCFNGIFILIWFFKNCFYVGVFRQATMSLPLFGMESWAISLINKYVMQSIFSGCITYPNKIILINVGKVAWIYPVLIRYCNSLYMEVSDNWPSISLSAVCGCVGAITKWGFNLHTREHTHNTVSLANALAVDWMRI